ncbi:hypothetical protein HK102_003619, partial [Quaeritorhiza haematococci]
DSKLVPLPLLAVNLGIRNYQAYYFVTNAIEAMVANGSTPWVQEWIACVYENDPNGQEACTHIAEKYVPNDALTEFVIALYLSCGIWATIAVGSSPALVKEYLNAWFPKTTEYVAKKAEKAGMLKNGRGQKSTGATVTNHDGTSSMDADAGLPAADAPVQVLETIDEPAEE